MSASFTRPMLKKANMFSAGPVLPTDDRTASVLPKMFPSDRMVSGSGAWVSSSQSVLEVLRKMSSLRFVRGFLSTTRCIGVTATCTLSRSSVSR